MTKSLKSNVIKFPNEFQDYHQGNSIEKDKGLLYNDGMRDKLKRSVRSNSKEYIAVGFEEEDNMNNNSTNEILLKYIDNLDKKYDDYKRDMIESEKRIYQNTKDSEERYEKRQLEFEKRLDSRFESIDKKIDKVEEKIAKIEEKIDSKFELMQNEIKENNKYLKSLTVSTILGIAAMVISVVAIAIGMYFSLLPILSNISK